jgi:hypothetical protein
MYYDVNTANQCMFSSQTVAVGAAHTLIAVVTPQAHQLSFGTIIGTRPDDQPGVMGYATGSCSSCNGVGGSRFAMFTDHWSPSGHYGPEMQIDTTYILVYRSSMQGSLPVVSMALATQPPFNNLQFQATQYSAGLHEYNTRNRMNEDFDIDFRDPQVDGPNQDSCQSQACNTVSGGTQMLGCWHPGRSDMQFRGTIHHYELHGSTLSDEDVDVALQTLYAQYF